MSREFAKIVDHPTLVRDMGSQAILNTDLTVVRKHEKRIQELHKEEERSREINTLKSELAELKVMLKALTSKK
jgi:hypothetical protein